MHRASLHWVLTTSLQWATYGNSRIIFRIVNYAFFCIIYTTFCIIFAREDMSLTLSEYWNSTTTVRTVYEADFGEMRAPSLPYTF